MKHSKESVLYIWDSRLLHAGTVPDKGMHSGAGAAFLLAIEGHMDIYEESSSMWRSCRTALVPPGSPLKVEFNGNRIAILHLAPDSIDFANLSACIQHGDWDIMFDHIDEYRVIDQVRHLLEEKPDIQTAHKIVQMIIYGAGYTYDGEQKTDPRIQKIIQLIKEDPSQSYSMEHLAQYINLSPTRFIHLFKEQTGVPIRRFRQWLRMKQVVMLVAEKKSLTEAALEAGFTDSAHFSRAFKNMFGFKPSSIFNRSNKTYFFLEH